MRVLLTLYFPRDLRIEGGGTLLPELASVLIERGHEPAIHAPFGNTAGMPCRVFNALENGRLSYRAYAAQLSRLARDFDAVWSIEQSPATGALHRDALPEGPKVVRLIASPYQTLGELAAGPQSLQYFKHWLAKNAALARLRRLSGTAFVVSSEYQRAQLIRLGAPADDVHVIPFGIKGNLGEAPSQANARAEYGLPEGPLVSYLGHYSPIKGVPVLIEAFRAIAERTGAHLALAWSGKGDESAKVHGMLKDPALEGRVHELGIVKPLHFLAASDVTVLPFVHSSFPHFPLVMIEAFAAGTPIVASDIGGISEMVIDGETGALVPPNDPAALALALERLLGDRALLDRIATNQLSSFRSRYSADVAVDRLLQIS